VGILASHSNELTTIYHSDCFDALQEIKDESIDLIFADPPYNIGKKSEPSRIRGGLTKTTLNGAICG
jgi:DNA modification methylase